MTRLTIGLAVGTDGLRAVGVAGERVRWAIEMERAIDEPLDRALDVLLERCPLPRWPRPRVMGTVGPAAAQVKRLTGLPALEDPHDLAAAVRESSRRFFLQNGTPLVTTDLAPVGPGTAWAAAFEAPVVSALDRACRTAGLSLAAVVPAAVALPYALSNDAIDWQDGGVCLHIDAQHRRIRAVRRTVASAAGDAAPLLPVAALAALGDRAPTFADAYGAACLPHDTPLVLRPGALGHTRPPSRKRLLAAGMAAMVGAMLALMAPTLATWIAGRHADAQLAILAPADRALQTIDRQLGQTTDALRALQAFEASRPSPTRLLRDLTQALPAHTALVALTVDTTTGTLVALGPDPTAVVIALEREPGLASPQIVGPVVPETVGAQTLQRLTVQFRILALATDTPVSARQRRAP